MADRHSELVPACWCSRCPVWGTPVRLHSAPAPSQNFAATSVAAPKLAGQCRLKVSKKIKKQFFQSLSAVSLRQSWGRVQCKWPVIPIVLFPTVACSCTGLVDITSNSCLAWPLLYRSPRRDVLPARPAGECLLLFHRFSLHSPLTQSGLHFCDFHLSRFQLYPARRLQRGRAEPQWLNGLHCQNVMHSQSKLGKLFICLAFLSPFQ